MRLNPVGNQEEPSYPDLETFARNRRAFLEWVGLIAGAALIGNTIGCSRKESDLTPVEHPAGAIRVPTGGPVTPPATDPAPPERVKGDVAAPELTPEERLRGKVAAPSPPDSTPPEGKDAAPQPPAKDLPPKGTSDSGEKVDRLKGEIPAPR